MSVIPALLGKIPVQTGQSSGGSKVNYPGAAAWQKLETVPQSTQVKLLSEVVLRQNMVVHAFNPSTWEAEADRFLSLRPA